MNEGWVKLYRSIRQSAVFKNSFVLHVWMWILTETNKERDTIACGRVVHLESNQIIGGKKKIAADTGIPESTVYRALQTLQKLGSITIQANNQFSVITIVNWGDYQSLKRKVNHRRTTEELQTDYERTTKELHTDTIYKNKEYKEYKEGGEEYACARARTCEEAPPPTPPPTLEEIRLFCADRNSSVNPVRFYNYNNARNWKGVSDWKLKLEEWESNEYASEDKAKAEKLGTYMSAGGHGEEHLNLDMFDEASKPVLENGGFVFEV